MLFVTSISEIIIPNIFRFVNSKNLIFLDFCIDFFIRF
nr:MAG TPA: hypothetical protein [Caudoviricetes sp.]